MDFLKSAVASAIAKGPPFPYSFGDRVDLDPSVWTLYNGVRREDGSNCSIFSFDIAANRSSLPLAKNALKKLRTLRHPGVIKVLDTVETDSYIYIATERVVPLRWHVKRNSLTPEAAKWGLYSIANTVKFINQDASSIHGNVKVSSIYTSESGEWKLGGFDVLSNVKDDEAIIYTYGSLVPDSARYTPPELARSGWDAIKKSPHSAVDSFGFGVLIYEVFNGAFTSADQAGQTKGIPPTMHSSYKRLVNANPKARLSVGHFLEQGKRTSSFFDTPLIKLTDGIDNLGVKSDHERAALFDDLDQLTDDFPEDFFKMKVLPELLKSVEFGGGGPKAFGLVMKIGARLSNDDFETRVTPVVIRLFGNPDRAIRVCLLDSLPLMIDRLPSKVVNDKIFPPIVSGFTDVAPVVREQTLKSVLTLVSKLSDRTINGELLKYLAKTANDEQPGIRTNTTICLGKIAKNLGSSNRSKVLIAAFSRSLRDPFVHARNAALLALAVTSEFFSDEDSATRVLPSICPLMIDKEKLIRDQATKTMDVYVQKIRKAAASMPDTVLPPSAAADASGPRMSSPQPNGTASSASWAGWAISSFTNKLSTAAGEIEPSSSNGRSETNPSASGLKKSAPTTLKPSASSSFPSSVQRQSTNSPSLPTSFSQSSAGANTPSESFFPDPDPEEADADAWGEMGDMDDSPEDGDLINTASTTTSPPRSLSSSTATLPKRDSPAASAVPSRRSASGVRAAPTSAPFDDGSEPDFAGWLAAQAQKKNGLGGKPLPKGLAKPAGSSKKPAAAKATVVAKPAAKKLDMKPKETGDDDDGWGEGW